MLQRYSFCLFKAMPTQGLTFCELFISAAALAPDLVKSLKICNTHTHLTCIYAHTHTQKVQQHTTVQIYTARAVINIYTSLASYLFHPAELISEGQRECGDIQRGGGGEGEK